MSVDSRKTKDEVLYWFFVRRNATYQAESKVVVSELIPLVDHFQNICNYVVTNTRDAIIPRRHTLDDMRRWIPDLFLQSVIDGHELAEQKKKMLMEANEHFRAFIAKWRIYPTLFSVENPPDEILPVPFNFESTELVHIPGARKIAIDIFAIHGENESRIKDLTIETIDQLTREAKHDPWALFHSMITKDPSRRRKSKSRNAIEIAYAAFKEWELVNNRYMFY